jgi:glucokinase
MPGQRLARLPRHAPAGIELNEHTGVYIAGGIAPRILAYLARSEFRRRFEQKGRFRAYLAAIPSHVIIHPAATFIGLISLGA